MLPSLDLTGRVAIVIGGTSGLGRAIAHGLAQSGADVVPTGRREALVDEVCRDVEQSGRRTLRCPTDATDRRALEALRNRVVEALGQVDVLVNAAGSIVKKPTMELSETEWNAIMQVNATATLCACQTFQPALAATDRGRIVNIASLNSFVSFTEVAAYAASKAAVMALTRSLAVEWAPLNINVNAIAPGVFRTSLNHKLLDETERGRELLMRTPMRRFGRLEEVVGAAVLLSSDAASFITGQCLVIDGGFLASGVNS